MEKPTISYKEDLLKDLRDVDYCGKYLSASLRESPEAFLLALRNVAEAQGGKTKRAAEAGVNREYLPCILSEEKNPRLSSPAAALGAFGLRLSIEPKTTVNGRSPRRAVQQRPGSLRAAGLAPSGRGGPKS